WRQADEAFDRSERQFEYPYFHSSGSSELTVPAGQVHVEIWHGPEYRVYRADVNVPTGGRITQRVTLQRVANLPGQGWWSGDVHVHMNYGGADRNPPVRHETRSRGHHAAAVLRAARRRGARQSRLFRGHGILGSSHHIRDLVSAVELRIPAAGGGGDGCVSQFRQLARAAGTGARVR